MNIFDMCVINMEKHPDFINKYKIDNPEAIEAAETEEINEKFPRKGRYRRKNRVRNTDLKSRRQAAYVLQPRTVMPEVYYVERENGQRRTVNLWDDYDPARFDEELINHGSDLKCKKMHKEWKKDNTPSRKSRHAAKSECGKYAPASSAPAVEPEEDETAVYWREFVRKKAYTCTEPDADGNIQYKDYLHPTFRTLLFDDRPALQLCRAEIEIEDRVRELRNEAAKLEDVIAAAQAELAAITNEITRIS